MFMTYILLQFLLSHCYNVEMFFNFYKQAHEYDAMSNKNLRECFMTENILMIAEYFDDQQDIDRLDCKSMHLMLVVHEVNKTKEFKLEKYDGFILKMIRLYTRFFNNNLKNFVDGDYIKEEEFLNENTTYKELLELTSSCQTTGKRCFESHHRYFFRKFFNIPSEQEFNEVDDFEISNRLFQTQIINLNNLFIDFDLFETRTDEGCVLAIYEKRTIILNGGSQEVFNRTRITPYYFYKNHIFYNNTVFNKMLDHKNMLGGIMENIKTKNDFDMELCDYQNTF